MNVNSNEHFCTIFDSKFLPIGLTMARTLLEQCPNAVLWVMCLDQECHQYLQTLNIDGIRPVELSHVETNELLAVKQNRSRAEYAWTLTPFACVMVFELCPQALRATYLDADLAFFDSPTLLINQMQQAQKGVLITEHAFAPEYAHGIRYGRFCVQFMTFNREPQAIAIMKHWQSQVLDWCYARLDNNRFGDQMYLNDWPQKYESVVHILKQTHLTLAPWNVSHVAETRNEFDPVFYHFHGLQFVTSKNVRLYSGYRINDKISLLETRGKK